LFDALVLLAIGFNTRQARESLIPLYIVHALSQMLTMYLLTSFHRGIEGGYMANQALQYVVAGMLALPASVGHAETYHPSTTGEQLVNDMQADPTVALNSFKRQRAMGYLDGIMDATVNSAWCPARKKVSHELNYILIEEVAMLSAEMLKANAMPLVVEALRKRYPCAPKSGSGR
jgi:hypothetical protein